MTPSPREVLTECIIEVLTTSFFSNVNHKYTYIFTKTHMCVDVNTNDTHTHQEDLTPLNTSLTKASTKEKKKGGKKSKTVRP